MEFVATSTTVHNLTNENLTTDGWSPKETSELDSLLLNIQTVLNIILLILVLISVGCSTSLPEIWRTLKRPIGVGIAIVVEYLLMPIIAFGLPRILKVGTNNQFSLYLTLCCPGGVLSNLFTLASDGCVPLSICMTTICTIFSVGMIPLHLFIYGTLTAGSNASIQVPYTSIMFTLLCIIVPASAGLLIRKKSERIAKVLGRICGLIGFGLLWFALGIRIYLNVDLYLSASWEQLIITFVSPLIGAGFGVALATLTRMACYKRRTICMETGCQNFTLALTIISVSFPPSVQLQELLVMPSFYAAFSFFELLLLVGLYRLNQWRRFIVCEKQTQSEADDIGLACIEDYESNGVVNKALDKDHDQDGDDLAKTEEDNNNKYGLDENDENDHLKINRDDLERKDDQFIEKKTLKQPENSKKHIAIQTDENQGESSLVPCEQTNGNTKL